MKRNVKGFKVGDVVMLKSGGSIMTVDSLESEYSAKGDLGCVYFSKDGEAHFHTFNPATLLKVLSGEPANDNGTPLEEDE